MSVCHHLCLTEDVGNLRTGNNVHQVGGGAARLRLAVVYRSVRMLSRYVLIERTAKSHVDELLATADSQHGDVMVVSHFDEGNVIHVAHGVNTSHLRDRLFAIVRGVNVLAANHYNTVQTLNDVTQD